MEFLLNLIPNFSNPFAATWWMIAKGGWLIILLVAMNGLWKMWLKEVRGAYLGAIDYVFLAINVPKQTEQPPKAIENFFLHMTGLFSGKGTLIDRFWKGKLQDRFSCELISRGGFVQFYVRVAAKYRPLFEAAIFAQYPDAEITETTDYVLDVPQRWPDDNFDMWGSELVFTKPYVYPIKTYISFEDKLSGTFKDPLATLFEYLSTLRPGEQAWIQIALTATDNTWHKQGLDEVKRLIGQKVTSHSSPLDSLTKGLFGGIVNLAHEFTKELFGFAGSGGGEGAATGKGGQSYPSLMQFMSPGEKNVVEQVQMKLAKPGFFAKIRLIYLAPRQIFMKQRAMAGLLGAFKQFSVLDLNTFTMDDCSKVSANYFFIPQRIARRQNKIMRCYRNRTAVGGHPPYILNAEELATLWHFPMIDVAAPLLSKTQSRRGEPPKTLPLHEAMSPATQLRPKIVEEEAESMPENIPFL